MQWQLTNSLQVEKAAGKNPVTSRDQIKPRGGGRVEDLWGLSVATTGLWKFEGPCSPCADGEQRDAYVVAMVPPRRCSRRPEDGGGSSKGSLGTAAHRELSTSNGSSLRLVEEQRTAGSMAYE